MTVGTIIERQWEPIADYSEADRSVHMRSTGKGGGGRA